MPGPIDSYNVNLTETQLSNLDGVQNTQGVGTQGQIPPTLDSVLKEKVLSFLEEMPALSKPKTDGKSISTINSLSEEAIMTMLGFENTKSQVKSAQSSLKTNAQFRKQENDNFINKLQEQAKKIEENAKLSGIKKFFKIFGAALGIIAGIAGCVVSGGTTLAVVGLAIGLALGAESIVSTATDGKVSLAAACKKMFGEDAGQWVAFGIQMALTITSITCSIGAARSAASAAKDAVEKSIETAEKVENTAKAVSYATSGVSAASSIASSSVEIVASINQRDIAFLKADQKIIQALMNDLMAQDEQTTRRLEEVLQNSRNTTEKVKEIVDELNEVTTAAVTA